MAQGEYKSGVPIEVTYQAPGSATGKTVNMEVYDEGRVKVAGGPTVLDEIVATGRYYGAFTPDAEGIWTVEIEVSDGTGKVVKQYAVAGHDIDSIGDAVVATDSAITVTIGKVDAVDSALTALENISKADVNAEIGSVLDTYDAPTKAELDSVLATMENVSQAEINAQVDSALADYDGPTKAELDAAESTIISNIGTLDPSSGAMVS